MFKKQDSSLPLCSDCDKPHPSIFLCECGEYFCIPCAEVHVLPHSSLVRHYGEYSINGQLLYFKNAVLVIDSYRLAFRLPKLADEPLLRFLFRSHEALQSQNKNMAAYLRTLGDLHALDHTRITNFDVAPDRYESLSSHSYITPYAEIIGNLPTHSTLSQHKDLTKEMAELRLMVTALRDQVNKQHKDKKTEKTDLNTVIRDALKEEKEDKT